jgi:hypothetical protein
LFSQCMVLPLVPIHILFPFPSTKMSNKHPLMAWNTGPCCNFT